MSGSLSKASGFVTTAAYTLGPIQPFVPEITDLQRFTFVPWVRTGLAAQLTNPVGNAVRATVSVTVNVDDDANGSSPVSKTLILRGPGDVLALDPTQIVRRYPEPGSFAAEETYLAHIEFDRPDLPWLFTPFQPNNDQLAPWMALIVIEERLFKLRQGLTGLPPQVTTKRGELQPLEDSWAWAHAQVPGKQTKLASVADRLTDAWGPANLSRLMCPRKLDQNVSYVACLVPAFDCGVRAGLGLRGGTLDPAWERLAGDENQDITLPVYDHWRFRMAPAGDFESLAGKLVGVPAPWQIGRRVIDFSNPRGGMTALADAEDGKLQVLQCALHSLAPAPEELASSAWSVAKREELRTQVNLGDQAAGDFGIAPDLPRVSPRLYARYQRAQSRAEAVDDSDWFHQLNTAPVHRVVAGLGTRVVQKDQEPLMQAAWAQVGEIDKVNQRLALAQFARFTSEAIHKNHLGRLALGDLAQVTRAVQGKLRVGGAALTIAGTAARSATAPASLTGAFRRGTRLRGPLTRFYSTASVKTVRSLVASGDSFQDFRRPFKEPDGIVGLSQSAITHFSPILIGRVMRMPPGQALFALRNLLISNAGKPSVTDQLLTPRNTWRIPEATMDLASVGATRLLDLYEAVLPAKLSDSPLRTEVLTDILVGISVSGITSAATRAATLGKKIGVNLPGGPHIQAPHAAAPRPGQVAIQVTGPHAGLADQVLKLDPPLAAGALLVPKDPKLVSVTLKTGGVFSFALVSPTLSAFVTGIGTLGLPATPALPKLAVGRSQLLAAIHPKTTVTAHMVARLGTLPSWLPKDWFDDGFVQPIMRAPAFTRPMYEALDSYDREWLIPGLGSMKETDLVTLVETNPEFTVAFLTGLSDEMGRELLWRGYPTDMRGTYFKRFWMSHRDELEQQIHLFTRTPLATHISPAAGGAVGRIVLLVRGELIRRYPNAIMLAQRQIGTDAEGHPTFAVPPAPGATGSVLFHVPLPPDIFITGFMLTEADLQNAANPWHFIISEHPTAPRFGLDLPAAPAQAAPPGMTRDKAKWANFQPLAFSRFLSTSGPVMTIKEPLPSAESTAWNATQAAGVARILLQDPFRAAWNGLKLIGPARS